jgi:quercetin dioxygenase-like cupin family protein
LRFRTKSQQKTLQNKLLQEDESAMTTTEAVTLLAVALGGVAVAGSAPKMIVKPAETLHFGVEYQDQQSSPQIAVVRGDPARTPISMLIRMKKSVLPMHSHSADYQAVVIRGTMKHWAKGESEANAPQLGPGSWWYQPGKQVHTDACLDEECLIYVHNTGKLDTIPDE